MTFSELGLSPEVLRAVEEAGYTNPTPIQERAIPLVLKGHDILGLAQTGTGKTASFTLPMIDILAKGRAKARMPRSLILEPTRELASQVADNFTIYGKYHKLSMALLIGGVSFGEQDKLIDRGVDVLVATPGRLLDHFERGKLMLHGVQVLVVDEADRMLDMGFIPDVERICSLLPPRRQTLFFSATMPGEIKSLVERFLTNPEQVAVAPPASPAALVEQKLVIVDAKEKREALRRLLRGETVGTAIVFSNTKRGVGTLIRSLEKHGFNAGALHGDLDQHQRLQVLDQFRHGKVQILVASDVAARGLDIPEVSHVFNFDVPSHAEDYIHRIGRTGRAGRKGVSITLAAPEDIRYWDPITKMLGREVERLEVEGLDSLEWGSSEGRRRGRNGRSAEPAERKPRASAAPAAANGRARPAEPAPAPSAEDIPAAQAAPEAAARPARRARPERNARPEHQAHPERATEAPVEQLSSERPAVERQSRERPSREREGASQPRTPDLAARPRPDSARPRTGGTVQQRNGRDRGSHAHDDKPIVGLGDHVPAFLLRPVPNLNRAETEDEGQRAAG